VTSDAAPAASASAPEASRARLIVARVLVVLGTLIGIVALFAGYVRYQALDGETFERTAASLVANEEIRDAVATRLVDDLYANVDVAAALEDRLPPEQQGLAAPIAAALRELTERTANRFLDDPRVQQLWVDTVAFSHSQLIAVLEDDLRGVETQEGAVFLDLRPLIVELGDRAGLVAGIAERLPQDAGLVKVVDAQQLETAQDATRALDVLGLWLWVVPLLLFAVAVWLARGRRRPILRWIGIGAILMGLAVLLLRRVAGDYVVDALAQTSAAEPAAENTWAILTSLLTDGAYTVIGLGVIVLLAVWLSGPSRSATASRRELAPLFLRRDVAYGAAAALFLGLLLWAPTEQTTRLPAVVAGAILLVVAIEALRRQLLHEHPDARADDLGEYARDRWSRLRGTPA
jgi:hypothetical protein